MLVITFAYVGVGLLFMALTVPLIRRRIGPNRWYGFRTPKTLSSPEIWYPANEYSGRWFFASGIAIVLGSPVIGAIATILRLSAATTSYLLMGWMIVLITWSLIVSLAYLKKL